MRYTDPQLLDALAARHVMGLQPLAARRRFRRLAQLSAAAATALARWEGHADRLAGVVPPSAPPATVWTAIERRTAPPAAQRASLGWLGGLLGLTAVAILAAGLVQTIGPAQAPAPALLEQALPASYVGILADPQGQARLLASVQRHARTLHFKWLGAPTVPAGTRLVLWAIPSEGPAVAIGQVPLADHASIEMPDTAEALLSKVARLAVAVQAVEADPTVAPADFLLTGHCAKLW